eukprot:2501563-Pyramimonas_sp.AAC.1
MALLMISGARRGWISSSLFLHPALVFSYAEDPSPVFSHPPRWCAFISAAHSASPSPILPALPSALPD